MELKKLTQKDLELFSRIVDLVDLEIYNQDWVILCDTGMIKPKRTSIETMRKYLQWGLEASEQPGADF